MAKHLLPFLMAVTAILVTAAAASPNPTGNQGNSTAKPTAYAMLERYGFPPGILPEGAESYELGPDGSFQVNFPGDCSFRVSKRYRLPYSSRVAGNTSRTVHQRARRREGEDRVCLDRHREGRPRRRQAQDACRVVVQVVLGRPLLY